MRIVIAPQEFKESLTAAGAAAAMAEGARQAAPDAELVVVPMSDGGPGTVEAVVAASGGGGGGPARAWGRPSRDAGGGELPPGGAALARLERIDASGLDPRLAQCEVVAATDVMNPLCGPEGASLVYGPQKGASPEVARELDSALRRYGEVVERDVGVPVLDVPGAGAAGGLGAALIAFLGARIEPGVEVVAEVVRLRERVRGADLVLTGEGKLDAQTGYGKTVAGGARIAAAEGVPVSG